MLKRLKSIMVLFAVMMGLGAGGQAFEFQTERYYDDESFLSDDQPHWGESLRKGFDYYSAKAITVGTGAYLTHVFIENPTNIGPWGYGELFLTTALFFVTLTRGFLEPYGIV